MQKRQDPDESFMGMDREIGGPAAKQLALLIDRERSAAKSLEGLRARSRVGSMSTRRRVRANRKN